MRRYWHLIIGFFVIASLAWFSSVYASPTYPPVTGFVVDTANIIDNLAEARITARLEALEATSTSEIAVATVPSLEGYSIEEYSTGLFSYWGIGKAKQDNGVLLLVAPSEREVRIEVGYGLEGALTDIESADIINNILVPAFREDEYSQGIEQAVDAIIVAVDGEYSATSAYSGDTGIGGWVAAIFILLVVGFVGFAILAQIIFTLSRSKSIVAGGFVGAGFGAIGGAMVGSVMLGVLLGIGFGLLLDWALSRHPSFQKLRQKAAEDYKKAKSDWPPKSGGWTSGGFGGGRSGGSSGGFGGFGGGSSGGGGASGRW